jgi:ABC-2 type transport system permease protein
MTTTSTPGGRVVRDIRLVGRQVYYEQLSFWLNPFAAVFTVGFSVVFLVLLGATGGKSHVGSLGGVRAIQYYVAGFMAYGIMGTCFNNLGVSLVVRREMGLLKRIRLSPLPPWAMLAGVTGNALVISLAQVLLLLLIGVVGYGATLPHNVAALVVALFVGVICFTALGVATSTLIPNQEAAGPAVSIVFFVFLFLSGLWYPLQPGSALARISGYFPFRRLITATFAPFDTRPGVSGWSWDDIIVMAVWGVAAVFVSVRRWRWAPHRS